MASAFEFLTCQTLSTILVSDISKKKKKKKKPKYEYVSIVKTLFYFLGFGGSNYHTTFFLQYVGGRIESLTSRLIVH